MNLKNITISLFALCISSITLAQKNTTNKYFRHLRYNHVSPYIKLVGTYSINEITAKNTSHYIFKYNDNNELVEITNNHYFTERRHPLASIGAYRTIISHSKTAETRIFLDKNGKRIFISESGKAKEIDVEIGARTGNEVRVLTGLKAGDTILTYGVMALKNGTPVKVDLNQPETPKAE